MQSTGTPAAVVGSSGFRQCGDSMALSMGPGLLTDAALERVAATVMERLASGRGLSLRIRTNGPDAEAENHLRDLCYALADRLADAGQPACDLALVVNVSSPGPSCIREIRRSTLGDGPIVICCGRGLLSNSPSATARWTELWNLWRAGDTTVACWPRVDSACPLLAPEHADNVDPAHGLQVPSGSAWVHHGVRLDGFFAAGRLDRAGFLARLEELVAVGDAEHERLRWPSASARHDAWLNRRLAIEIVGIGDYLQKAGLCPTALSSLQHMQRLLDDVRNVLVRASARLAGEHGAVPALTQTNPQLPVGPCRDAWRGEWRSAMARSAVRNRCLLALSPGSLPAEGNDEADYRDLLPLMAFADVCGFPARPTAGPRNFSKFRHFHQRLLAVLGCIERNALIAQAL